MLKTYYLHGFSSRFDINSDKLKNLARLGPVYGHDIDYTQDSEEFIEDSLDKLNPVTDPDQMLKARIGQGVDHQGRLWQSASPGSNPDPVSKNDEQLHQPYCRNSG